MKGSKYLSGLAGLADRGTFARTRLRRSALHEKLTLCQLAVGACRLHEEAAVLGCRRRRHFDLARAQAEQRADGGGLGEPGAVGPDEHEALVGAAREGCEGM